MLKEARYIPQQNRLKERNIMELTITQNGGLYFAHHKVSQRRTAFFRWQFHSSKRPGAKESSPLFPIQGPRQQRNELTGVLDK